MLAAPAATNEPSAPRVIGVVGDSVAASLVPGLEREAGARGIGVASAAIAGCGAAGGVLLDDQGQPFSWSDDCERAVPIVQDEITAKYHPELVLWLSTWETQDRVIGGNRMRFGTPEGDRELLHEMEATLTRVTANGARLVMLTPPPPVMGRNGPPDPDRLAKTAHLNRLIDLFAYLHADRVEVVDFAAIVCPNGVPVPDRDGRHAAASRRCPLHRRDECVGGQPAPSGGARRADGPQAGTTVTGMPLTTAVPDTTSSCSSSARTLEFTPGRADATPSATPSRS